MMEFLGIGGMGSDGGGRVAAHRGAVGGHGNRAVLACAGARGADALAAYPEMAYRALPAAGRGAGGADVAIKPDGGRQAASGAAWGVSGADGRARAGLHGRALLGQGAGAHRAVDTQLRRRGVHRIGPARRF